MTDITVVGAGGEYMESVVVVEWHKKLGDMVSEGDLVVTVETAKAATEIEAPASGVLSEIRAEPGVEIDVGGVLGVIGNEAASSDKTTSDDAAHATSAPQEPTEPARSEPAEPPVTSSGRRIVASPLARRVAAQRGIDLSGISPTSPSGRIRLRDVEAQGGRSTSAGPTAAPATPPPTAAGPLSADSGSLNLTVRGKGIQGDIVFLHGFGGDGPSWQPLLSALGNEYRAILVDLPAHGKSAPHDGPVSVDAIAASVAETLETAGIGAFHLVAHSLGGAVALALSGIGRLDILSLTLLAPAGLGPEIDGDFISGYSRAERVESLKPWLDRLFADPTLVTPAFVAATMGARQDAALRHAQAKLGDAVFPNGTQTGDLTTQLTTNQFPQKIVWGREDRIIPMRHAMRATGMVGLHLLEATGHMPHIEKPAAVAQLIRQNIKSSI